MNISTSECSSECESGWTMYLDQTSNSTDPYTRDYFAKNCEENAANSCVYGDDDIEDDEDLSMVSDASSGPPPHFQEYDNYAAAAGGDNQLFHGYASSVSEDANKKKSKQKSKTKETRDHPSWQQNFCLADTASSPIFHFPQDNVATSGFSQVFSAANFESQSIPKKQFGFHKSSTKGKSGSFLGRKRQ